MKNAEMIAEKIFQELPKSMWSGKTLMEIEVAMQEVMKEISNKICNYSAMDSNLS